MPTTSIIIVHHYEANTTLLRGLMSIIRKSPLRYIKEIILVDDASEGREYLGKPLDDFVKRLPVPVKIMRNKQRLGLIRSRLRGADAATGDTMTFLDAHIEATNGWLPPLLNEIKMNRLVMIKSCSLLMRFHLMYIDIINISSNAFVSFFRLLLLFSFYSGLVFFFRLLSNIWLQTWVLLSN